MLSKIHDKIDFALWDLERTEKFFLNVPCKVSFKLWSFFGYTDPEIQEKAQHIGCEKKKT